LTGRQQLHVTITFLTAMPLLLLRTAADLQNTQEDRQVRQSISACTMY
jgi:hypothetical protein